MASIAFRAVTGIALASVTATLLASSARAQDPQTPPPTSPSTGTAPQTPPAPTPPPAPPTQPEENRRRVPAIGPQIGLYLPTDSRTKDAFGDTWVNYGLGFRPLSIETRRGSATLDISAFSSSRSGSNTFIVPVSFIYKIALGGGADVEGETDRGIVPYAGFSIGVYPGNVRADKYNVHSGWTAGFGGSALLGTTFGQTAYLEARYHLISKMKSFDLSGLNLALGFRF